MPIGDVQGCDAELRALLARLNFSADRDQLWFVGDLVNRGPGSLATLRLVRALGRQRGRGARQSRPASAGGGATAVSAAAAPIRSMRCWRRPIATPSSSGCCSGRWRTPRRGDLMVHAGVVPQWTVALTLHLAAEVARALRDDPRTLLEHMYGDEPRPLERAARAAWSGCASPSTCSRGCACAPPTAASTSSIKGPPPPPPAPLRPWFEHPHRASRDARIIFGHWSALGLVQRPGVVGLDTGCVWGGALTALEPGRGTAAGERRVRRLSARRRRLRLRRDRRSPGHRQLRGRRRIDPGRQLQVDRLAAGG